MRDSVRHIGRYVRTVRHLTPQQVVARVRLRVQRRLVGRFAKHFETRWTNALAVTPIRLWPSSFVPLDARRFESRNAADRIVNRRFDLLNREVEIGALDWHRSDVSQLWRFHLQYWDWAWHLVAHEEFSAINDLWTEWSAQCSYGRGDAWSPYVVSLRLWTLCGIHRFMLAGGADPVLLERELRRHTGYLRANLETDIRGNHLVKNLKALAGAAVFLGNLDLLDETLTALLAELDRQVLADGGHYELTPSYHGQVLGDVLDVLGLLDETHHERGLAELRAIATAMRAWLAEFVGPDGTTPVLNDGYTLGPDELEILGVSRTPEPRLVVLAETGYVIARPTDTLQVIVDVGWPCPAELPGHAQADCLSFVVADALGWVVVDTGCSEYGSSNRRAFERSTAAHNTVEVDRTNQTEVWGAFRAGRRARPSLEKATDDGITITVVGSHDGYRHLPGAVSHERSIRIVDRSIHVADFLVGAGVHRVRSRLHLRPGWQLTDGSMSCIPASGQDSSIAASSKVVVSSGSWSPAMGVLYPCDVLEQEYYGELPITLTWSIQL